MSRRDSSRVHIAVRQNDTLAEFENFKKKFLFANKQITKQNCSLSMKIEELNAHISTLYVENLRLRASEIALQSQVKREQVKSHKIMADAEAAVLNLLKHFGIIRESYNVPTERPRTPKDSSDSSPPSARSRKPPPRSPSAPRYVALPSVSDIDEEPELHEEDTREGRGEQFPLERMSSLISSRRRSNASRLPVPSRVSTPPPGSSPPARDEGFTPTTSTTSRKRKLTRRASGIISPNPNEPTPRPRSPVLGSPMQQDIDLSAEEEAAAMQDVEDIAARGEAKEKEREEEREVESKKPRKKSRTRDRDRGSSSAPRLKDVTNSPRRRRAAASSAAVATAATDNVNEDRKKEILVEGRPSLAISPPSKLTSEDDVGYLPTPLPSSATNTPVAQHFALPSSDAEMNGVGGRERRSRKSVNYAEPKLNTKMRKPDVIPPLAARNSLSSFGATFVAASASSQPSQAREGSSPELEDTDAAPSTRPSSSASSSKSTSHASGRRSTSSLLTSASSSSKKRKHVGHRRTPSEEGMAADEHSDHDDQEDTDEETDAGGEADSEFSDFRAWANINVSSRKKSKGLPDGVKGVNGYRNNTRDVRDREQEGLGRRHSIAV